MNKALAALGTIIVLGGVAFMSIPAQVTPLLPDADAKAQGLMLIAVDKKTGEIIPDFQSGARVGTLKANAIAAGRKAADVDEKWVTQAEYQAALDAFVAQSATQRELAKQTKIAKLAVLEQKARATWTAQELFDLQELILDGLRFNANPTH